MNWESAWAEAAAARQFVERLSRRSSGELRPAVPPTPGRDPYLSAWNNVAAALGNAPELDRERLRGLLEELDAQLASLRLPPPMLEAAQRAVRALLARRWLLTDESLTFVYEPFESLVPLSSLGD
jgi:hypothetical protein